MVDADYINANFIYKMAGTKKVKAYIAAQGRRVIQTMFGQMFLRSN